MNAAHRDIFRRLERAPAIPLVQVDDPDVGVAVARALVAGGLTVLEVVLRTDSALRCLERIKRSLPGAIVGAGTVLSADQASSALLAGADFIVSPGFFVPVVETALKAGVDVFPGVATPSELMSAWNFGIRTVKFFPASQIGGPAMLRTLSEVFLDVRFIPTGGITAGNLHEYLSVPSVVACGGSWLAPKALVAEGRFDEITRIAALALTAAQSCRPHGMN